MDKRKIFIISLVVITIMLSSFVFYFYQVIYSPNFLVEKESKYLFIPTGSDFEDVQRLIYDQGLVNDPVAFGLLAKFMKYDRLVKPGKYLIGQNSNNLQVIRKLRSGEQVPVRITFNNARLLSDVAVKLTVNIELDSTSFLRLLESDTIVEKYGFNKETFRCMFIPNTYEVYWTINGEQLLDRLNREYHQFWNAERIAKAKEIDLNPVQVTILASIVQAETTHSEEGPIVAGL